LKEVGGAAARAMEPQVVFLGFGPGRRDGVAGQQSGEIGLDVDDLAGRWARERSGCAAESAARANEHTNAPMHESA